MKDILEVFTDDLPRISPEREIDFSVDLLSDTQSISTLPYQMAAAKFKELKAQLMIFLEKGFIQPRIVHGLLRY